MPSKAIINPLADQRVTNETLLWLLLGMPHLALEILPANFGSFPPISPGYNPPPPAIRTPSVHTAFSGCASRPSGGMCHTPTPPKSHSHPFGHTQHWVPARFSQVRPGSAGFLAASEVASFAGHFKFKSTVSWWVPLPRCRSCFLGRHIGKEAAGNPMETT
eukprot:jgi/Chrzof1/5847/Cz16g17300.t1